MTFATTMFVISGPDSSPLTSSYSFLRHEESVPATTIASAESFDSDCCDMDILNDEEQFVTYQTLNDCSEQQESLIDADDDDGTDSDASINRENSDDSLFQMLSSVGFSSKKRVTFKPMVKVIHFESAEFAEQCAIREAERQRQAKIDEASKSFVSGVKFFVGNNFDSDDYDDDFGFSY